MIRPIKKVLVANRGEDLHPGHLRLPQRWASAPSLSTLTPTAPMLRTSQRMRPSGTSAPPGPRQLASSSKAGRRLSPMGADRTPWLWLSVRRAPGRPEAVEAAGLIFIGPPADAMRHGRKAAGPRAHAKPPASPPCRRQWSENFRFSTVEMRSLPPRSSASPHHAQSRLAEVGAASVWSIAVSASPLPTKVPAAGQSRIRRRHRLHRRAIIRPRHVGSRYWRPPRPLPTCSSATARSASQPEGHRGSPLASPRSDLRPHEPGCGAPPPP